MFWRKASRITAKASFWTTDAACTEGFLGDIQELLRARCLVLAVTHFSGSHERVSRQLATRGVLTVLLSGAGDLAPRRIGELCKDGSVALIPFPLLQLAAPFPRAESRTGAKAAVLVPELHPTRVRDALVEEFAMGLPFETSLMLYTSLASPLMRAFGSDRIATIMQKLGLSEGERLEHPWLAESMRKAQERISAVVKEDRPARSQGEWFELNAPQMQAGPRGA
jgi:hypothetical protein